jgi:hypothetical protein
MCPRHLAGEARADVALAKRVNARAERESADKRAAALSAARDEVVRAAQYVAANGPIDGTLALRAAVAAYEKLEKP